ncbi:hypothetical protein RRSWK_04751 [Rhodopirellula sp. SWK7]|nr:hypothetical protein RRSWK_04751 [Rhodopirellula sp. SWK7]
MWNIEASGSDYKLVLLSRGRWLPKHFDENDRETFMVNRSKQSSL